MAIVTGGGRGIGRAIALLFAREGARVAVVARTRTDLEDVARAAQVEGGGEVLPLPGDVTVAGDVQRVVQQVLERWGRIDILVNNAGVGHFAPVAELPEDAWDEMMAVNLKGPFLCARAVAPVMAAQRSGHIINISSVAGTTTFPGGGGYCASKWGLMALTDVLMQELKPYEVKVSVICPGSVQTGFGGTPPRSYSLLPEDVATVALEMAAAPRRVILNQVVMRPLVPPEFQR